MLSEGRFEHTIAEFDRYNSRDPNVEFLRGELVPKELLYSQRMTERLKNYVFEPREHLLLAARCQHIGRWEIPRANYPKDKKGYFQWRNKLKEHHATVASAILTECGYDKSMVEIITQLLLKKDLPNNKDTQLLEDVICLVFLEHYVNEFADKYEDAKVIDILRKTMQKMTPKAIDLVGTISLTDKIKTLIYEASVEG